MNPKNEKCVLVIDEALPLGLLANTAAILGITLGKLLPPLVGEDVRDAENNYHRGITQYPIPILKGDTELIKTLRRRLYEPEFAEVVTVDFSDLAQSCNDYSGFIEAMNAASGEELRYLGIALCGAKKKVSQLTGSLPLLR